jgi:altronate dehydratase small subunit
MNVMAGDEQQVWTALRLTPHDNVATALRALDEGDVPRLADGPEAFQAPQLRDAIGRGHKFALSRIGVGGEIVKYGQVVGIARTDIAPGEHVHLHNIEGLAGRKERDRSKP